VVATGSIWVGAARGARGRAGNQDRCPLAREVPVGPPHVALIVIAPKGAREPVESTTDASAGEGGLDGRPCPHEGGFRLAE